ncbi:hypothetical protein B5V01_11055 [Mesorhizobium erdmanii]|uniref:Uncharacterized protein n=1 Tax=Mesorhizobium erdmanii TaxID=1777866 RepID=A0A4Q1V841_9HYPH|nr:hypothetical protein B5V01_11055 [Mesorhizobium erdmanii]
MPLTALTTAAILLAATGLTEARPDIRTMSCQQLHVLTTGPNTYDRYVRQFGNECDWPQVPMSVYVPTRDGHCPVYKCDDPVGRVP